MPNRKIPQLYKVSSTQLLEMVRDLHYLARRYKIIIAVDPYEIIDYCFPISPDHAHSQIDLESLVESQAALHYLFNVDEQRRPPVVLLPDYKDELRELQNAINFKALSVYSDAEMISRMIQIGDLDQITSEQKDTLEQIVQERFQILLTVLLGIHSLGGTRMRETCDNRLRTVLEVIRPEDRNYFGRIMEKYMRSPLYETIFEELEKDNTASNPIVRDNIKRANQRDAGAIDRLIYLNTEAESASRGRFLRNNYLFLYLSTTKRSRKMFDLSDDKAILPRIIDAALPKIRDRKYPFWRNRDQVFAYVISRNHSEDDPRLTKEENTIRRTEETVKELRSLSILLGKVEKFERVFYSEANDCNDCILDGKIPTSCALASRCQDIKATANKIKEKREEVNNWRLFKQINSYKSLLASNVTHLGYGVYLALFKDIFESRSALKHIALERLHQRWIWISRASEGKVLYSRIRGEFDPTKELDLRSEKDQVTGIDQYLPGKPRFTSVKYSQIISPILKFYRQPNHMNLADEAYDKFFQLEPDSEQEDDEYDLLACYLYLAFNFEGENIHSYIKDILLPKIEKKNSDAARRESLYVLCWSARRSGFYEEANDYALRGIKLYPGDPRFHHGRALNIYAGCVSEKQDPQYKIADAIAASEKALQLYKRHEQDNADVIAANHNNIAYFLAFDVKSSRSLDRREITQKLETAREYMENLKGFIKEKDWNPLHPEFFHTRAFLEYQAALHDWVGREQTTEQLKARVRSAAKDIEQAIDIYEGPKYKELKNEIEHFYQQLSSGG